MRIAIYHNLPSGGGKRVLQEMTRRLNARHTVDVYSLSTANHDYCDLRDHCRKHTVFEYISLPLLRRPFGRANQLIRTLEFLRMLRNQKVIAQIVDEGSYDVVFAHNCAVMQSPGLLRYLQTPVVYYCQEPPREIYEPRPSRAYREFSAVQSFGNRFDPLPTIYRRALARIDRANVRAASTVIVNSDYSREVLYRTYGVFAKVGYLGIDIERFRPIGLNRKAFVLSVGALTALKGFDFLINSLGLIEAESRPQLTLISNQVEPEEGRYLAGLAESRGVAVRFTANVTDEELVRLYSEARLTLYSPVMEPFGLVPLESMACGTPVVAVREGGVRESVRDGEGGVLVERDAKLFADVVESLLKDSERRDSLGRQARAYVEKRWSWASSLERIEEILEGTARV